MKQTLRTDKAIALYRTMDTAKYGKMADEDKVRVWKIARAMRPVALGFEEESSSAAEKMKPSEDFSERWQRAQEYERMKNQGATDTLPMTDTEYRSFVAEFRRYDALVNKAVGELGAKEVELEFEGISEDAFGKLMASNEWTINQALELGMLIIE